MHMRSRLSLNAIIVASAAAMALVLTIVRPSPKGLISFGMGEREVRAAPGTTSASAEKHNLTALKVVTLTLVRIRDSYVDPARIDPKKMLFSALDNVQFEVPEVLVEAFPDKDEVVVVVNDKRQSFSTEDVDSMWRLTSNLKKIFRFVEANMNPGADLAEVEYAAVNGMLDTLDPHSVLLDPETAREMEVSTSGKFGGLGIVIRMHNKKLTVVRPIKGTPAHEAGLQRGDHIIKINGEVTDNLTLQESVDRMRGDPNTEISVWVRRKGEKDDIEFTLTRAIIRVESVEYKLLSNNVGYMRLKQFSGQTSKELIEAMAEMKQQGAQAWVLDMRWNPGGLLEQAIQVSDVFLDKGTIVTTVSDSGRDRDPRRANRKDTDQLPLAVLVNGSSASASEIVAGALKNLDRGIIIGTNTFGKGSVQVLYDNADGSKLKLTIAQYLTPGDRSIQSVGITPDIDLHRMFVPKENTKPEHYLRLLRSIRSYKEKDLDAALVSEYADAPTKPVYNLGFLYEPPTDKDPLDGEEGPPSEDDEPLDDEIVEDFEIMLAKDLVAGSDSSTREDLIKEAKRLVDKRRAAQDKNIAAALEHLGVDWSTGKANGKVELDAKMELQPGTSLKAGDTVKLVGTITNNGTGTAHRVYARATSDHRDFDETELVFGKIGPGETRMWTTHLKIPEDALDRVAYLDFQLGEANGAKAEIAPIRIEVESAERPVFAYTHQLIDGGNGDGLVQKKEQHTLRVTIKNIGSGIAASPTALLRNASGMGVELKKARFEMEALKPGESKTLDFIFDVTRELREDEVVIEMTVYDSVLHASVVEKLVYPVRGKSDGPKEASGYIKVSKDDTSIYEGASAESGRVGWANKGAGFKVVGKQGAWTKVEIADGRPGFIATSRTTKTKSRSGKAKYTTNWQVTPPSIALQIPSYESTKDTYTLSGKATDETHVEDVYIFVSNYEAKVDNQKVFYKSNRSSGHEDTLSFEADIPLSKGSNRVTVIVRENDEVKSSRTMYLYRK